MPRDLLILTVCSVETAPGTPCGAPPAGVDIRAARCLCREHLQAAVRIQRDAERLDDLSEPQRAIAAVYELLHEHDAGIKERWARGEL